MTLITSDLFAHEVVDRLNSLLPDYVRHADDHFRKTTFIRTLVSRYASSGRPLSGYFAVCGVIEIQWTILAQVLAPPLQQPPAASTSTGILPSSQNMEAQASNIAWATLMSKQCGAPSPTGMTPYIMTTTRRALGAASQCFTDLLEQVEDFGEVDSEMYAFETMSESLVCASLSVFWRLLNLLQKLATVCTLALREVDVALYDRVKLILSGESPVVDAYLQDTALKSATVLVRK